MNECDECEWRVDSDEPSCMYDCPAFDYGGEDCPMFSQADWED